MNNGGVQASKWTKVTIGIVDVILRPEGLRRIIPVLVRQASELHPGRRHDRRG